MIGMNFECLPNELLFDIFELLNSIELIQTFSNLNTRLNRLLSIYLKHYPINFRSISSQRNFDSICQNSIQLLTNQIHSISLSNDDQTPNLPTKFLSYQLSFDHLHSLTLHSIHSFAILNEFLTNFSRLTHLYLVQCGYYLNKTNLLHLINKIWSMSKLVHCQFDCFSIGQMNFPRMSTISYSIEYFSMKNLHCDFTDLGHIVQHTPNLREFHPNIECVFQTEQIYLNFDNLTNLNLIFNGSKYSFEKLVEKLPNLHQLKIQFEHIVLNGDEWEKIVQNHLQLLKSLSFKMTLECHDEIELDQLIESFRTQFWLEQRQWFIRCDWFASNTCLYTLPYAFDEYIYSKNYQSKSTCDFWIYDQVKKLIIETNSYSYRAQFPNVRQLILNCSFDESIRTDLINFKRISSLEVIIRNDIQLNILKSLIQLMTKLYSLKIHFFNKFPVDFFRMDFRSIYRIDLMNNPRHYARYLTNDECKILENSLLIQQCRILVVNIENRSNLLRLISKMKNLNSFIFRCKDEINSDEFQQWIEKNLSTQFSFSHDHKDVTIYRLWRIN